MSVRARLLALLGVVLLLWGGPAMATEEPAFRLVSKTGAFEIRDYPALIVAEVTVAGDQRTAAARGFRKLAGYIFGGNTRKGAIAMTAPVSQARSGARSQSIAMTAPVLQTPVQGEWVVRFTMPSRWTLATLPAPNDPSVRITTLPATRMAVTTFSGVANQATFDRKSGELVGFVTSQNLRTTGEPTLAQYDPPWTLPFLRRNEVMVAVGPGR
ncbi:heme-binding protein [soil metagenome]